MTDVPPILHLHDVDLLVDEFLDAGTRGRLKKLGLAPPNPGVLERARGRLAQTIDRRWVNHYERALKRYGRGLAVVRDRVCQGCFITLPTSVAPNADESLTLCESCGRILYWS